MKQSRRFFLKRTSEGLAGAIVFSSFGHSLEYSLKDLTLTKQETKRNSLMSKTVCEFGVEGSAPREADELSLFLKATRDLGAQFIVCQFAPEYTSPNARDNYDSWCWDGSEKGFGEFAASCRKYGLTFFANQEITNYTREGDMLDKNGKDILEHPDKTHRWDITGKQLEAALKNPEFRGVLYDEAEHGQMRRETNTNGGEDSKSTGKVHPYFASTDGMTVIQAYDAVYKSATDVAHNYRKRGLIPMTEDVFPAMLFTFARAGFDIAIKFLKEGIDPVFAAIAMGAARQYGREFCVTPDLWGLSGFPGHPPEELRASLLYAYWIGSSKIFVENILGFIERKTENGVAEYELTEYGRVYKWFVKEYVPAHPRPYSFRDIRPEVAILRFDDSCWGQGNSFLPDNLYGAVNLKTTTQSAAWFQIWNLLTFGHTKDDGISFHTRSYKGMPHDFFCPLKDVIVYDHLAGEKEMEGLKLVFLTGVLISDKTMKAVRKFVRKGGLCVSLISLAPAEYAGKSGKISDGVGHWLFVNDFRSDEVRYAVTPFLGKPDEISYHTVNQKLIVKQGKDGNTISIQLQNAKDKKNDAEASEYVQVW